MDSSTVIPKDMAEHICAEIRQEYQGKWWTLAGMQCWGCTTFSKGDPQKMCLASRPDGRGCNLVTARYESARKLKHG